MGFIYDWCEERLEIQSIADDILAKFVPGHVNIFYCFGGIVLTSFIFQGASGFALTIYYRPTVVEAFSSVQLILYHVNLGWFIRSIHRWSSGVMVLVLILHIVRVYLTGGFKKPRELIWITGVILAVTTVSFGVTGYSLPWDQVGYWASKIVTSVPEALDDLIPGVLTLGKTLVLVLRGGFSVSQSTLTRFYSVHTFVLPLVTLILLIIHFSMLRKQGISGPL
jgi:cytochrome b6